MAVCEIDWGVLDNAAWDKAYTGVRRANLLQSADYASAATRFYGQTTRTGLINIEGAESGVVRIYEAGLCRNLIHALILDRGPLWFDDFDSVEYQAAFFKTFANSFPARFGRRRRIISEMEESIEARNIMASCGFRRLDRPGYQTSWLDLTPDQAILRAALDKKWRNALSKSERQGLVVQWDTEGRHRSWLLRKYQESQAIKRYRGASVKFMTLLASAFEKSGNMVIGTAEEEKDTVAAILVFCHGKSATYQIGWINERGRDLSAHNFLLWQAILYLKNKNIKDFDLGGMNDETAKGVKKFKDGLGGQQITLVGQYC